MGYMRSIVDTSKIVFPNQWVLSLVVKPHGKNSEHAIILVEDLLAEGKKFVYRRYDFVAKEQPEYKINKVDGVVVIKNDPKNFADFPEVERNEYFWSMIMKDHNFEGCYGASWIIMPKKLPTCMHRL